MSEYHGFFLNIQRGEIPHLKFICEKTLVPVQDLHITSSRKDLQKLFENYTHQLWMYVFLLVPDPPPVLRTAL